MNGFKIMLGAIGVQLIVMGAVTALHALGLTGDGGDPSSRGPMIGAAMALIGALLIIWPLRSGLARDLAGACSILFVVFGVIWFLQGLNKFPGSSFMNGQIFWSYAGALWVLIGVGLFVFGLKKPKLAS